MARRILDSWFTRGFLLTVLTLSFAQILAEPTTGWAHAGADSHGAGLGIKAAWSNTGSLEHEDGSSASTLAPNVTSLLVIPAADFRSSGTNPSGYRFDLTGGALDGGGGGECMMAPAYLPSEVTLQTLNASVYDNDGASDIAVALRRLEGYSGTQTEMASLTTTGQSTSIQNLSTSAITNPTLLYPDYTYYVTTCLSSAQTKIYAVRLWYSAP